jgi:hypothetical protein
VITGRGPALYISRMLSALLLNRSPQACPERSPARGRGVADLKLACRTESILRHLLIGVSPAKSDPARTVKTTAGALETVHPTHAKSEIQHNEGSRGTGAFMAIRPRVADPRLHRWDQVNACLQERICRCMRNGEMALSRARYCLARFARCRRNDPSYKEIKQSILAVGRAPSDPGACGAALDRS